MVAIVGGGDGPPLVEYEPGTTFPGVIGRTVEESEPAWPGRPHPPEGTPDVVFFVLDDVGYGQLSAFGGEIDTPNIDAIAADGLKYANFMTTAVCSATRGCVLTGRNHHTLGLSLVPELSLGFPAHNGVMGFEHGFLSEILVEKGFNTFCVGKWHLTHSAEITPAGPYNRWPLGRGFERYYGFLGGDSDQWHPQLVYDNHIVEQPYTPAEGYHFNVDITDRAIGFVKDAHVNAPDKPYLLYYATGAGHAPHQVEPEWTERYKGRFDQGWDELRQSIYRRQIEMGLIAEGTPLSMKDPDVPAWDTLDDNAKRIYARQMETYAGFISQTDHHFGRLVEFLKTIGRYDNTLFVVLSDNGASAEGNEHGTPNENFFFNRVPETLEACEDRIDEWGSENTFNHYSWGWTWAGDTPFKRWKRETYRGGCTDPLIVSWKNGIAASGEVRKQFAHAIDLVPTVLDALDIEPPKAIRGVTQSEMHGRSFAPSFADADADTSRGTQYFEMLGHRSIYHDGWKAVCPWPGPSFKEGQEKDRAFGVTPLDSATVDDLDANSWELYNLTEDPGEANNVAADNPELLEEMKLRWWTEAGRYGVLPLATADLPRLLADRPQVAKPRDRYVYYPHGSPIQFNAAPQVQNRPHSITASVTIPDGGAEGVLFSQGNRHGGYTFFVKDNCLHYAHNYVGIRYFTAGSTEDIPAGAHELRFEFEPTGDANPFAGLGVPGKAKLYIDGRLVGAAEFEFTVPIYFGMAGASCGYDAYDTVWPDAYAAPFEFTGEIADVVIDLSGELTQDPEADYDRIMAQQ